MEIVGTGWHLSYAVWQIWRNWPVPMVESRGKMGRACQIYGRGSFTIQAFQPLLPVQYLYRSAEFWGNIRATEATRASASQTMNNLISGPYERYSLMTRWALGYCKIALKGWLRRMESNETAFRSQPSEVINTRSPLRIELLCFSLTYSKNH